MLKPPTSQACVECGLPYGPTGFAYHADRIENGPSYWSDRGLLCSVVCSMAHAERREKEGDPMTEPAPNPLERGFR